MKQNDVTLVLLDSNPITDVAHMIHEHPTLSETMMEAVRGIYDKPIHI